MQLFRGIIFLMVLVLCLADCSAQNFKADIHAGLAAAQVDGDDMAGYHHAGVHAGVTAIVPLHKQFNAALELNYNQKGSRSTPLSIHSGLQYTFFINLHYSEVAVLLHYTDRDKFNFGLGLSFDRLGSTKAEWTGVPLCTDFVMKKNETNWLADIEYLLSPHFRVGARYSYSVPAMGSSSCSNYRGHGLFNNVIYIRFAYVMGFNK